MRVFLSYSDYLRNFEGFLRAFDPSSPDKLIIETHDKWVNVHPVVLTMVAALGSKVAPKNIIIDKITATSGHYLARMGFFKVLGKESPYSIKEHDASGRFIPITQIKNSEEQSQFVTEMIPLLHLSPHQADAIKYTVGELVRNVLEHARTKSGAFVAAQYYSHSNIVRLGICDVGVGIRETINYSWHASTDLDAIKLALIPGVTGTTRREGGTGENAGAGLFFIKSMAMVARDYFVIYSGTGLYKLIKRDKRTKGLPRLHANPQEDKHTDTNEAPRFPGTVVGIDISLDQTSEFRALLGAIRNAYIKAVKERKKERYKKPIFI
jgi:anti-sigma regulatory factor (Ser/Thr protein kinase)